MADTIMTMIPATVPVEQPAQFSLRQRFKISELPLVKEQRATIDSLLLKFKKQGGYDSIRKQVWAQYNNSDSKTALTDAIFSVADAEIEKDPNLLSRDRGKAATLMQGALERSGLYQDVESRIDREIVKHVDTMLDLVRDIRKGEVGDEKALEEEQRGSKTDDDYRAETEARATEREKTKARMDELTRQTAELKAKIKAEEERRRLRELAKKEEEERKAKEAEEEQRRVERQKRLEEEEKKEAERIRARDERARLREEARKERDREFEREREERHRKRHEKDERRPSVLDIKKEPVDEKELEATALELLLSEGKQLARKSKPRDTDYEEDRRVSRKRDRSRDSHRRERTRSRGRKPSLRGSAGQREESREREEGEAKSQRSSVSPVVTTNAKKVDRSGRMRSASPLGIDRYVPGGGLHRSEEERLRDRDRRKPRDSRTRESESRYDGREYDSYRHRDRARDRSKDRDRERRSRSPRRRDDKRDDRERRDDRREDRRDERRDSRREERRDDRRDDRRDERRDDRRDDRRDERRDDRRDRDRDRDRERDRDRDGDRRDRERRDRDIDRYIPGR